jgi:hypothetical protein
MSQLLTEDRLQEENREFSGTPGVSEENCACGFIPAFYDMDTGRVEISRYQDGKPAPMHLIHGLPDCWVVERDELCRPTAILQSIISGFVRDGCFYTRSEAMNAVVEDTTDFAFAYPEAVCS